MNGIVFSIFLASLAFLASAKPADNDNRFIAQSMEKARQVRKCISDNKADPNAKVLIPRCVLGLFGVDTQKARENFKTWVQNTGSQVQEYFNNAEKEARDFFNNAKSRFDGFLGTVADKFQSAKDKVHGWLDGIFGKTHETVVPVPQPEPVPEPQPVEPEPVPEPQPEPVPEPEPTPEEVQRRVRSTEEQTRAALNAYLEKAKAIAACISKNHEGEDAENKIPDCILELFSVNPKEAKAKFEAWLQNQGFGSVVGEYFKTIGGKAEEFYKVAKVKVGGVLDTIGDTIHGVKTQVVGWVNNIFG